MQKRDVWNSRRLFPFCIVASGRSRQQLGEQQDRLSILWRNAGSEQAKARKFDIKILSPDEFFRIVGESV